MRWTWLLAVPVVLLTGLGVAELARTPPALWLAMWLGHSWMICPWLVLALAMPIFVGLLWSFRRLAPTRLRAAGAAAGLAAGAFAATVY
ncbi:NrsF family protein, partial [Klebsiella pneumoniae]|uniref:NrsF family protein n=1 Tax=Klebsiella pneumoniae TaxID=573 RepID=UPI001D0F0C52